MDEVEGWVDGDGDCDGEGAAEEVGDVSEVRCDRHVCRAADEKKIITLTGNALFLFKKLKTKYGLDDEALMEKLLTDADIAEKGGGEKVSPGTKMKVAAKMARISRYIPAARKREILSTTNGRCAYPNCTEPKQILHHVDRYSASHSHDSVVPLCKEHHEFAHNGLIDEHNWRFKMSKPTNRADLLYREYRRAARA